MWSGYGENGQEAGASKAWVPKRHGFPRWEPANRQENGLWTLGFFTCSEWRCFSMNRKASLVLSNH